eukprot:1161944-Pelagomonas_calceolata.AAC.10
MQAEAAMQHTEVQSYNHVMQSGNCSLLRQFIQSHLCEARGEANQKIACQLWCNTGMAARARQNTQDALDRELHRDQPGFRLRRLNPSIETFGACVRGV